MIPVKSAPPENCQTMAELRVQIDRVDSELLDLLTRRAGYIDRAIVLKQREDLPARIDARVAEVIGNVRRGAKARGLDADLAERLWTELIEWSIAREEKVLER